MTAPEGKHRGPPPSRWRPHLAPWVWTTLAAVILVVALIVLALQVSPDPEDSRAASVPAPTVARHAYTPQTLPPLNVPTLAPTTTVEAVNPLIASVVTGSEPARSMGTTTGGTRRPETPSQARTRQSVAITTPSTTQPRQQRQPATLPTASSPPAVPPTTPRVEPAPAPAPEPVPAPVVPPAPEPPAPVVEQPAEPEPTPTPVRTPEPTPTPTRTPSETRAETPTPTPSETTERTATETATTTTAAVEDPTEPEATP